MSELKPRHTVEEYKKEVTKSYQSIYDFCPICKTYCFFMMSRTQAVHHIYDCIESKTYSSRTSAQFWDKIALTLHSSEVGK